MCVLEHFVYGQTFNVLPLNKWKFIHMASHSDHTGVSNRLYALFPEQGRTFASVLAGCLSILDPQATAAWRHRSRLLSPTVGTCCARAAL